MNRRTTLAMTTTALLCLAVGLSATASLAQQKSLKEQLVGTWTLVSSDQVRSDGSKVQQFGANPKGINVFEGNGHFFLMIASSGSLLVASADNPKIVSIDPNTNLDCFPRRDQWNWFFQMETCLRLTRLAYLTSAAFLPPFVPFLLLSSITLWTNI
jgi:hypothetical protein